MDEETRRGYTISITEKDPLTGLEVQAPNAATITAVPTAGEEVLTINGEVIPYTKNDDGYYIYFLPPAPSLLEAARNFIDTQREVIE